MDRKVRCRILTPEKTVYQGDVDMVVAPALDGEIGILPLHAPLVTPLKIGELHIKRGDDTDYIAVAGGYLEVREDVLTVLAEDAEIASQIDVESVERAKAEAEREVAEAEAAGEGAPDFYEAQEHLEWALTRLNIARKD